MTNHLATLALAATEAEDAYKSQKLTAAASKLHHEEVSAYCAFRAAATPSAVLALIGERDRARAEAEAYKRGWFLDEEEGEDFPVPTWYAHNKGAGSVPQCTDVALVSHLASLEKPDNG